MNVSLTTELEAWIQAKVRSGLYQSASEVVRDSLRLLRERDEQRLRLLAGPRDELAAGVRQPAAGPSRPPSAGVLAAVKRNGRRHGPGSRKPAA